MSWKALVPLPLLSWQTGKTKIPKKRQKNPSFQCGFVLQQEFGVYSPFLAEVPLRKCISNPNVFVIYSCKCLHFSETVTHETQGHGALAQKNAQDSVRIEKSSHWPYKFTLDDPKL